MFKKDLNFDDISDNHINFLHICIPFNDRFVEIVSSEILTIKPELTIIHSSVGVGTTSKIFENTKLPIVHSPVMGTHTNMVPDIKRFKKIIGGVNAESSKLAANHLENAGLKVLIMNNSNETELSKLLDTTYFGWNVIYCKLVGKPGLI